MYMEVKIYVLIDPETNEIRYVGKTIQSLKVRLTNHLYSVSKHNPYKFNWIQQLKSKKLIPIIMEIEICDENNWAEREKFWINYYKKISKLTNLTIGGENGLFFSDEILNKISDGVKKKWKEKEFRDNLIEKTKFYWQNDENRKNRGECNKGKKRTLEHKSIISSFRKEQWKDNMYREKMSSQSKELWNDENYRKKQSDYFNSEENKKIISNRFKNKNKSEETKLRMSMGRKNKKPIMIMGFKYNSITEASKQIPMNRDKLRTRLNSKNFTDYFFIQ